MIDIIDIMGTLNDTPGIRKSTSRKDKLGIRLLPKERFRSQWRGYGCSPLDGGDVCWVALARAGPQSPGIRKQLSGAQVSCE